MRCYVLHDQKTTRLQCQAGKSQINQKTIKILQAKPDTQNSIIQPMAHERDTEIVVTNQRDTCNKLLFSSTFEQNVVIQSL